MFKNYDIQQKNLREFLGTAEGQKIIKGFLEGSVTDFTKMFAETNIPEIEVIKNELIIKSTK